MIETEIFGTLPNGLLTHAYTLIEKNTRVTISDFGATILSIKTPDVRGDVQDIVLGFDTLADYAGANPACYGATIGPVANRSDKAEIVLEGVAYTLPKNDGSSQENNLHTSLTEGLHKRLWKAEVDHEHNTVTLSCTLLDGEFGLPGDRNFSARFELVSRDGGGSDNLAGVTCLAGASTCGNADSITDLDGGCQQLRVTYICTTSKPTFVNMTNHSYFNLAGHASGSVLDHEVCIHASSYLPIRKDNVSEGTVEPVKNTPFDFREAKALGENIHDENEQLRRANGYDHCFAVDGYTSPDASDVAGVAHTAAAETAEKTNQPRSALLARDPKSGRRLHITISAPGAHLYTGNWLNDTSAKDCASYAQRAGFAFEPEFYPDCSHHQSWPQPLCTPEHPYIATIVYTFSHDSHVLQL